MWLKHENEEMFITWTTLDISDIELAQWVTQCFSVTAVLGEQYTVDDANSQNQDTHLYYPWTPCK